MQATYDWSISSAPAIWVFYVPNGFICYIVACLRCLWATAELQDSRLRGLSFQMGNFCFLPGTHHLNSFFGYGIECGAVLRLLPRVDPGSPSRAQPHMGASMQPSLGGILYKIRIFTCSISWHILKTRTQTDPQVPNWTQPVLRADGESAHETSGIHQAEDIDEDRTLPQAPIGSSSEVKVPANLRNPNPK